MNDVMFYLYHKVIIKLYLYTFKYRLNDYDVPALFTYHSAQMDTAQFALQQILHGVECNE